MSVHARTIVLALIGALGTGSSVGSGASVFAAPQVIVANGGPLKQRVVLTDWEENLRLMLAASEIVRVPADSLRDRPRVRIAMYWGIEWKGRLDLPDSVGVVSPYGAQSGAFYPAYRRRPPLFLFGGYGAMAPSLRRITPEGLAILKLHKIPVAVE